MYFFNLSVAGSRLKAPCPVINFVIYHAPTHAPIASFSWQRATEVFEVGQTMAGRPGHLMVANHKSTRYVPSQYCRLHEITHNLIYIAYIMTVTVHRLLSAFPVSQSANSSRLKNTVPKKKKTVPCGASSSPASQPELLTGVNSGSDAGELHARVFRCALLQSLTIDCPGKNKQTKIFQVNRDISKQL